MATAQTLINRPSLILCNGQYLTAAEYRNLDRA
jgi:hypothetical protein